MNSEIIEKLKSFYSNPDFSILEELREAKSTINVSRDLLELFIGDLIFSLNLGEVKYNFVNIRSGCYYADNGEIIHIKNSFYLGS